MLLLFIERGEIFTEDSLFICVGSGMTTITMEKVFLRSSQILVSIYYWLVIQDDSIEVIPL